MLELKTRSFNLIRMENIKTIEIPLVDPFKMAIGKDGLLLLHKRSWFIKMITEFFSTDSGNLNIWGNGISVSDQVIFGRMVVGFNGF